MPAEGSQTMQLSFEDVVTAVVGLVVDVAGAVVVDVDGAVVVAAVVVDAHTDK